MTFEDWYEKNIELNHGDLITMALIEKMLEDCWVYQQEKIDRERIEKNDLIEKSNMLGEMWHISKKEREKQNKIIEVMEEALNFYGFKISWRRAGPGAPVEIPKYDVESDNHQLMGGKKARQALEKVKALRK